MAITRVAVAGGTGNLGPAIVNGLLEAGFQLTVLSRSSSHQLDPRVQVQVVDYNSLDSLVAALRGQDAFINVLPTGPVSRDVHLRVIEAAVAAGIQRFIPSEFGCDTSNSATSQLPVFGDKVAVIQRLQELATPGSTLSYTAVITGPFFDWGLEKGFIVNLKGPSTAVYDGGDVPFSTTTLRGIGRAVVGVLKRPEQTKNRHIYVAEANVTQNQLLNWSGKGDQLERTPVKTEDLEKQAYEALQQSPPDIPTFARNLIRRAIFGGKYGTHFTKVDNEIVGVSQWTESEIVNLVKKYV
ncbi:oxidoreductase CipA [Penicillium macrosclerotiorum]|uniref:oxidoreductase CipA n=1 Tax=Penicillium macrosclerotiorum TaxID=303699 RepID=UPI00254818FC|nr:oxidoreductase CipA [Penicillium macrosclerotiorum]KAJ5690868.1 oxidoreductase CipA [Penicillium macrosclerotiorum]